MRPIPKLIPLDTTTKKVVDIAKPTAAYYSVAGMHSSVLSFSSHESEILTQPNKRRLDTWKAGWKSIPKIWGMASLAIWDSIVLVAILGLSPFSNATDSDAYSSSGLA